MASCDFMHENVLVAFVDTSVIDPTCNDYASMEHQFVALKKHIDSHKLILLTHEIAMREMENHIREALTKQADRLISAQKSKELVLLQSIKQYAPFFKTIDQEKIIADAIKALKAKIADIGITILKTGNISVKTLLDDYFSSTPPFGAKDKKSEFPDAIMLQSLTKAVDEGHRIHIIAKDGDWERACTSRKQLVLHKHLGTLLDQINKDNIASSAIKGFLSTPSIQKKVNAEFRNMIECMDFHVDGLYYDRKGIAEGHEYNEIELINIENIDYSIHAIEDIDCSSSSEDNIITAIVTVLGSARITVNCSFLDEENSAWDNETHDYIFKSHGNIHETHELLFPVRLTLTGDYQKELQITNYSLIGTQDLTSLGNFTLINREYISEYDSPSFHVEKILSCPSCSRDIKADLISDGTDCVFSSERQMGLEREYRVDVIGSCPHCNEEYHITGQVWEYPENCCNCEQDIKIRKLT